MCQPVLLLGGGGVGGRGDEEKRVKHQSRGWGAPRRGKGGKAQLRRGMGVAKFPGKSRARWDRCQGWRSRGQKLQRKAAHLLRSTERVEPWSRSMRFASNQEGRKGGTALPVLPVRFNFGIASHAERNKVIVTGDHGAHHTERGSRSCSFRGRWEGEQLGIPGTKNVK